MASRSLFAAGALRTAGQSGVVAGRSFQMSTSANMGLKESSSQTRTESQKKQSLDKHKQGGQHVKTDSEEAVNADRGAKEDVATMQERTKKAAEEARKTGKGVGEGM